MAREPNSWRFEKIGYIRASYVLNLRFKILLNLVAVSLPLFTIARASLFDDLASTSPDIRSKAAETLRERHLYRPTARLPWKRLVDGVKMGESMQSLLEYLSAHGISTPVFEEKGSFQFNVQLDRSWALVCAIDNSIVTQAKLKNRPKAISVSPPAGYHGFWRTYRVDGRIASLKYYESSLNQPESIFLTH